MWFLSIAILLLEVTISYSKETDTKPPEQKRIVCYYTSRSTYRPGNIRFTPQDLDPFVCTHLIYAYATLDKGGFLEPSDPKQDTQEAGYQKFVSLKKVNPNLKLMLGLGGTKVSVSRFSKIAADPELRKTFARNAVQFLRQFDFDGLDVVWKYPGFGEGSADNDKGNYVQLLRELKLAFRKEAIKTRKPLLLLSLVVPSQPVHIEGGFDLKGLSKYADFMTILTYDYHIPTEIAVHHSSPTYRLPGDDEYQDLSIDATVRDYFQRGVKPEKLNIAIPLFGLSFQLDDPEETEIGSLVGEDGDKIETGQLYYNQICQYLQKGDWTIEHANKTAVGPYAYKGVHWISYDDEEAIRNKAKYVKDHKLGGVTFWAIDMDDFKELCHNRTYPLINAAKEEFMKPDENDVTTTEAVITVSTHEPLMTIETTTEEFIRKTVKANENHLRDEPAVEKGEINEEKNSPSAQSATEMVEKIEQVTGQEMVNNNVSEENTHLGESDQIAQETKVIENKHNQNDLENLIALSMTTSLDNNDIENYTQPFAKPIINKLPYPIYKINGQRDIVFQNIQIWVTNNYVTKN